MALKLKILCSGWWTSASIFGVPGSGSLQNRGNRCEMTTYHNTGDHNLKQIKAVGSCNIWVLLNLNRPTARGNTFKRRWQTWGKRLDMRKRQHAQWNKQRKMSGGAQFESQPGHLLLWPSLLTVFLGPYGQILGVYLRLAHFCVLSHISNSLFTIIHRHKHEGG